MSERRHCGTPRRVLMTTDAVGGVWSYSLELAGALSDKGVEILLAVMGPAMGGTRWKEVRRRDNVLVMEGHYKLEWMDDPWEDMRRAGDWLMNLSAIYSPDLVHLNGYAHAALPFEAPALVVGHSCVFSWFEGTRGCVPPPEWAPYRAAVTAGLRAADAVTAQTVAMLSTLRRIYGDFRGVDPIFNGRSAADYPPQPKRELVLTCGRLWDEAKNVAAVDRVAPDLVWPVFVAGDDESPDGGHSRFSHIQPLGILPPGKMAVWFGAAPIFALPARYEPFGLAPLEAALAGCALVLGDIETQREVWEDAALFAPPDDDDALRSAIQSLIADGALRNQMAKRARRRAMAMTPDRMGRAYLDLYRRLTERVDAPVSDAPVSDKTMDEGMNMRRPCRASPPSGTSRPWPAAFR